MALVHCSVTRNCRLWTKQKKCGVEALEALPRFNFSTLSWDLAGSMVVWWQQVMCKWQNEFPTQLKNTGQSYREASLCIARNVLNLDRAVHTKTPQVTTLHKRCRLVPNNIWSSDCGFIILNLTLFRRQRLVKSSVIWRYVQRPKAMYFMR